MTNFFDNLNEDQQWAYNIYKQNQLDDINAYADIVNNRLRQNTGDFNETDNNFIGILDSMFGQCHVPSDINLFRAIPGRVATRMNVGNRHQDLGFLSTSTSKRSVHRFLENDGRQPGILTIYCKSIIPCIPMEDSRTNGDTMEDELLLPRGQFLTIKSIRERLIVDYFSDAGLSTKAYLQGQDTLLDIVAEIG